MVTPPCASVPKSKLSEAAQEEQSDDQAVSEGSVIFVAAGEHRFYDITEELVVLVVFARPKVDSVPLLDSGAFSEFTAPAIAAARYYFAGTQ